MRPTHASQGMRIMHYLTNVMHAYTILHALMGAVHACFFQVHLQLGVLFPRELMLGVLLPKGLMNSYGLHIENLLQDEEVYEEDASCSRLAQFNSILLFPRCLTSGIT